jgi:tellurite methyltransferase
MSDKWNQRYAKATSLPSKNPWLATYNHLIPTKGHALDLACGLGQNSFYLEKHGLSVNSWDISQVAIDALNLHANTHNLAVTGHCIDITKHWPNQQFDVIYVSAYLQRELCPQIMASLKPGGILFYQTFNQVPLEGKPSNPKFQLAEGELLELFTGLSPLVYIDEQEHFNPQQQPSLAGKALLIAKKPF